MSARVHMPGILTGLLRSELERAITESALSEYDTLIARRYLVEKVPQIEIAVELGWERKTVSRRTKDIALIVERTANKLYP